jgi:hypothetical protein
LNARDIEKVINQLALILRALLDDRDRVLGFFRIDLAQAKNLRPGQDRRQRSTQFVGKRGQKFVFHQAGSLRFVPRVGFANQQLLTLALYFLAF